VTILDPSTLRPQRIVRGFGSPHIAAFGPSGDYLYVTDDARGQLAVILGKTVRKIFVGYGAHHMAFSPDQRELWIALGERARSIAVVDTSNPLRPRLEGNLDPHGLAHDLAFSPNGRFVWVTYDDRPYLRHLHVPPSLLHVSEAVAANHRARMDDHPMPQHDARIQDDARVEDAVLADRRPRPDDHPRVDHRARADRRAVLDHRVGADVHARADRHGGRHDRRGMDPRRRDLGRVEQRDRLRERRARLLDPYERLPGGEAARRVEARQDDRRA